MKHKHHIVPKHMGGTDDPENIIELTVEEHANAHKILWETYGKREDFIAWKCLSGQMKKEVFMIEKSKLGGKQVWLNDREKMIEISSRGGRTNVKKGNLQKIAASGGKATKGMKFWYNLELNSQCRSKECPGKGWVRGRLPGTNKSTHLLKYAHNTKGSSWYHNPETGDTKMIKKGQEIPEGWVKGRLKNKKGKA